MKNRRYEAHYDHLNDMRVDEAASRLTPTTLPQQAFGRVPIEWVRPGLPVWAWVS